MASNTVEWLPTAEESLAQIWITSSSRNEVTKAAAWLEKQLATVPYEIGESRASTLERIVLASPIGMEFEIIPDDNLVIVHWVFPFAGS